MPDRPSNLIYTLDETPRFKPLFCLSLQHVIVGLMYLVYPILLVKETGGSVEHAQTLVNTCLLVMGISTILQCSRRFGIGSGFLAVQVTNPIFLPLSIQATRMGGAGLVAGLLAVTGVFQMIFSRIFSRLRSIFPPEVSGVIITMLGLSMVNMSVCRFTGYDGGIGHAQVADIFVSLLTLATMLGLAIAAPRQIRSFAIIIGIGAGYAASWICGVVEPEFANRLGETPLLSVSCLEIPRFSLDFSLLVPFIITGLISTIDTAGGIITCQKINDDHWNRPDPQTLSRGVFADGLGNILAGCLGGFGVGVGTANVGLVMATGAAARIIAIGAGAMFVVLAFMPKVTIILSMIPGPVMGAVLVYAVSFIIVSGMQLILTRMMDDRRRAMVGLSLVAGLSVEVVPGLYQDAGWLTTHFPVSSVAVASVTAIVLNLIFRLGTSRRAVLDLHAGANMHEQIHQFMSDQGAAWGARENVVFLAKQALVECVETVAPTLPPATPIQVEAIFDEYNLILVMRYQGMAPIISKERPSLDSMINDPESLSRLSGYLLRQYSDRISVSQEGNLATLTIHFDH